jgi:hypothetical protein
MPVDVRTVDLSGQQQADLRAAVEDTGADPQILEALPPKGSGSVGVELTGQQRAALQGACGDTLLRRTPRAAYLAVEHRDERVAFGGPAT